MFRALLVASAIGAAAVVIATIALADPPCANCDTAAPAPLPPPSGGPTPTPPPTGGIVDNFDGPALSRPDGRFWNYTIANPAAEGWLDGEIGEFTDSTDNVRLDGQGNLVIEVVKTASGYTTGRIDTRGKLDMLYGKVEARIKLPRGKGIWPAFWMLGSNPSTPWPHSGELDIAEMIGDDESFHVTLHGPQSGYPEYMLPVYPPSPIAVTDDFHNYWAIREKDNIQVGIDDVTLATYTPASLPPGAQWVFNAPMYAILNIQVAGAPPGPPDATTPLPATMLVDWMSYTPS
jgi:beta-glucanase (GH16 family)